MEENKRNELEEISLKVDALYEPTPEEAEPEKTDAEPEPITELEVLTKAEERAPVESETSKNKEKKTRREKSRAPNEPKPPKERKEPALPISEPALPLLVCVIVFAISLLALIIDRFIYPFSQELLAPVILQLTALIIPAYLCMMITSADKSIGAQFKEIGVRAVKAEYVFFMIFTALFTMCASLTLTLMLGGAEAAARGITLLGTFTAGVNEYTVSYPYLILTYAIIPAIAEEMLFRGVIFSRLEKISFPLAATLSCVLNALFGFSLGGLIPSLFVGAMLVFVLYTTRSLIPCMIVHLLINLYRLFLEANISAYFLSSQNKFLLLITLALTLAISSLLFFSESARIFRKKAQNIASGNEKSANKSEGFKKVFLQLRSTLAYKPSIIFSIVCGAIFAATVIIGHLT